jgi:hypothetical protein
MTAINPRALGPRPKGWGGRRRAGVKA